MIYTEASGMKPDCVSNWQSSNNQGFPSTPVANSCSGGLLHSLEVAQSRLTEPFNDKKLSKSKLPNQDIISKCLSCEGWQEWAAQSQQSILKIQTKLIQREKLLHDKFLQMKANLQKQAINSKKKQEQHQKQVKMANQTIFEQGQTIKELKSQLQKAIQSQRFPIKGSIPQNAKIFQQIKEEDDDQSYQDTLTRRKADDYRLAMDKTFQITLADPHKKMSKNLQVGHLPSENLLPQKQIRGRISYQDPNLIQTKKKLQITPINQQLKIYSSKANERQLAEDPYERIQNKYHEVDSRFDAYHELKKVEPNKYVENCDDHEQVSIKRSEMRVKKDQQLERVNQLNINYNPKMNLSTKNHHKQLSQHKLDKFQYKPDISLRQPSRVQSISKLSGYDLQSVQPLKQSSDCMVSPQNNCKTLKLNNIDNNVEKSRFYQTATQCSFVNGMKSRITNASYRLPNDEVTTLISHSDDKKQMCRNPERRELDTKSKADYVSMTEEMQKLKFENENLKSYNRVLLQKLSNSRPKKY